MSACHSHAAACTGCPLYHRAHVMSLALCMHYSSWSILRSLHWLRVPKRIAFRLAVLVYRCLHGTAPAYLSADLLLVSDIGPRQRLRSAMTSALVGRRTQRSTIGDRAFVAPAPAVWNSLPEDVRASTSLQLFRRRLKAELFRRSLGPRHSTWLLLSAVTWPCSLFDFTSR